MKKYIKPNTEILDVEVETLLDNASPLPAEPGEDNIENTSKGHTFAGFDIWGMSEEE